MCLHFSFASGSLILRFNSASNPLQTRCKSVPYNRREMGLAPTLVGTCNGLT